ncbi:Adenylate cyclase type 9 [Echinococcus granulosus]|nr:Adenylate cyclase type 9 [Echinococcus granulosus]
MPLSGTGGESPHRVNIDEEADYDFEDIFEKAGQDIRQDHQMTNIFDRSDTKTTFFERLMGALEDIHYLMSFSSPIISHYFQNVTECMIKRKVRQFMKLLVAYWCVMLIKSLRQPDASVTNLKFAALMMGSFIFLYIYTFRRLSRSEYKFISLLLTIGSLNYTLYESCRQEAAMDGSYAYPFSLIVTIIVFLPLDMNIIVPVLLVFCVIFCIISSRQVTYSHIKRDLYKNSIHPLYSQVHAYKFYILEGGTEAWSIFAEDYCMVQATSWLTVIFIGCYLRFWNDLRRRSAFSIIGKSVRARNQIETSLTDQRDWITAIMPVQVRDHYIAMLRDKSQGDDIWVFSKSFNEVSILFADIVGFTKMSSSKTATKIVMLLNDLYNRFDDLSTQLNCEKIGTLGDCYYAVAGCPVEREDHAMCCVEFGLGMCRIIKVFNRDNNEEVNMRVGVHTGRVNAAIIGCSRFRYDVYSTDVIVANEMETYGLPGRVHISHTTFKLVKGLYRFAKGPPLPMLKEQQVGMGGLDQVEVELKTYFVDPLSSLMRKQSENYGQTGMPSRILTLQSETKNGKMSDSEDESTGSEDASGTSDKSAQNSQGKGTIFSSDDQNSTLSEAENVRRRNLRDIRLVQTLQDDPKHQVKLFRFVPLTPIFHRFQDTTIETAFKNYMQGYLPVVTIESPRLAPVLDVLMISLTTMAILVPYIIHLNVDSNGYLARETPVPMAVLASSFILASIFAYGSTKHASTVVVERNTGFRIFASYTFREIVLAILTLLPSVVFFVQLFSADIENDANTQDRVIYLEFGMLTILVHCMATSSFSWVRGFCILISAIGFCFALGKVRKDFDYAYCEPTLWYMHMDKPVEGINERIASIFTLAAVVYFITTENERSIRLWYYVLREAEFACRTAVKESESAQQLLDNVIPPYIFTQLAMLGHRRLKAGTFCFANAISDVAVSFATLTNFFKSYYREDYRGGEGALKLLNTIICAFDNLMKQPQYASVEKIKTVNDCYMIAAGLNQLQRESQVPKDRHIYELMEFDFALYDTLNEINDKYIIGTDKFQMKIGYYIGDVTAGIIGSRKPIYDIWGNTVNVASRMYSTGSAGQIQTPKEVTERLGDRYNYEYRGRVFVKGKGDMLTYFVHKKGFDSTEYSSSDYMCSGRFICQGWGGLLAAMVLTSFSDIGKAAKDIFTKYFKFNLINFDFKSGTEENVDLHIQCTENDNQIVAASDVTFKPVDGVSVKTKVDSKNQITNDIEIKNQSWSTRHNIITTVDHNLGTKQLKLKNSVQKDKVNAEIEMDFASKYPRATASLVVGDKGYVAGAQVVVDTSDFKLKNHTYSVGYSGKGIEVYGSLSDHKDIEWRVLQTYQRISVGCMFGWAGNFSNTKFGVASLYKVNEDTFIKGRIDENSHLALAYGFKPTPETQVIVALETSLNGNNVASGSGLTFEISN